MTQDLNTLICLFHHEAGAQAALEEILEAGVPESNVTLIGTAGSSIEASKSSLAELNVPARDLDHLLKGLDDGGAILSVSAISDQADKVEAIFRNHKADQIDEADVDDDMSAQALPVMPPATPLMGEAALADEGAADPYPLATDPYPVTATDAYPLTAVALLDEQDPEEAFAPELLDEDTQAPRVIRVFRITTIPVEDLTAASDLDSDQDAQDLRETRSAPFSR